MLSLGIEQVTLALLAPCFTLWTIGKLSASYLSVSLGWNSNRQVNMTSTVCVLDQCVFLKPVTHARKLKRIESLCCMCVWEILMVDLSLKDDVGCWSRCCHVQHHLPSNQCHSVPQRRPRPTRWDACSHKVSNLKIFTHKILWLAHLVKLSHRTIMISHCLLLLHHSVDKNKALLVSCLLCNYAISSNKII